jgi:hypothetical protein
MNSIRKLYIGSVSYNDECSVYCISECLFFRYHVPSPPQFLVPCYERNSSVTRVFYNISSFSSILLWFRVQQFPARSTNLLFVNGDER